MLPAILTLLCLAISFGTVVPSSTIPTSMTVDPFQIAFFPCQQAGRGQPLWVINGTEYASVDLLPDHTTNISGLLVYARPEYNNTDYQCRFVTVTIKDVMFLDKDILTSPNARLTVTEDPLATEPNVSTCKRTVPTQAAYDYTAESLTVGLGHNLTDVFEFSLYSCSTEKLRKFSSQNCSSISVNIAPTTFNESVIVTFFPRCSGSLSPLDYSIHMAIDFSFITKSYMLLSTVQQLQFFDTCLESALFGNGQYRFSDLLISISANNKSRYISFSNENFFDLRSQTEVLFVCFISEGAIQNIVGNVKEVLVQEVGVVNPDDLCAETQFVGDTSYAMVFGSRGTLPLNPTEEELESDTMCTLKEISDFPTSDDIRECILLSPLVVIPNKIPGSINDIGYNFHGTCEHVLSTPCNNDGYEVVGDFIESDLSLGRVGLRLPSYNAIIDEGLNVVEEGIRPDNIIVIELEHRSSVSLFDGSSLVVSIVHTISQIEIISTVGDDELCGLCGSINGSLISSDGVKVNDFANKLEIDIFASSWLVEPSDQILHEYRRECVVVRSDTIIGDPLLQAPLWIEDRDEITSLCYEVHGHSDAYFNLVSDECVLVNALYTLKDDINVVSEIGVRAVTENLGSCVLVTVTLADDMCATTILSGNNDSMHLNVGELFHEDGIQIRQQSLNRVRISVPNCEQLELIMLVTCDTYGNMSMIHFNVSRGVNLRPTSHGLLGQFWNIPVSAVKLRDPTLLAQLPESDYNHDNLYMVTVQPAESPARSFFGELFSSHWDNYESPCLYAGNSQGGASGELNSISDPVIEGRYYNYIVPGRFAHTFAYNKFDSEKCMADKN